MKSTKFILCSLLCFFSLVLFAQKKEKTIKVEVTNQWDKSKTDEPVVVLLSQVKANFPVRSATVWSGDVEIPSQLDDLDGDHRADELAFLVNLAPKESKVFKITFSSVSTDKKYESLVFARMLLSDEKGKHTPIQSLTVPGNVNVYNKLHHHGPAFESELVAYRLYFDHKQTIDAYGKFNKGFEIEACSFYPTDEQLARGFGDDVLRVSGSCGAGALKGWDGKKATHVEPVSARTERILAYGPVRAIVEAEVVGWKYQGSELCMTNRYTLYGGHRDLLVETFFSEPLKDEVFCTGVQDIRGSEEYSDGKGLIGCWGTDWPVNDTVKYAKETVGLATYIPKKYVGAEVKDKPNYLYTIKAKGEKYFCHYTMFTSMKEAFGYKTPEAWFAYMREWKDELEHPVKVKVK